MPLEILKLVTSWKQNIIFYCCISPQYWIFASRVSGLDSFRPLNILQTGSNWFCQPVDLKTRKSAVASCQIEIHFSIQITLLLTVRSATNDKVAYCKRFLYQPQWPKTKLNVLFARVLCICVCVGGGGRGKFHIVRWVRKTCKFHIICSLS